MIIEKAYAKINPGLDICGVREDGYHELSMIMHSIELCDVLYFKRTDDMKRQYICDNSTLKMDENNLVCQAAELFCRIYGIEEGFEITLDKRIPLSAGLAGGSTDAAAVLRGLNRLFDTNITKEELRHLGVKIGADVPFCIEGGTVLAEGIGEKLTKLEDMIYKSMLIAKPDVSVSTAWAYKMSDTQKDLFHPDIKSLAKAIQEHSSIMYKYMGNSFEKLIINHYPVVEDIINIMKKRGALAALMSGSGPTVFGIFPDDESLFRAYHELEVFKCEFIYKIRA